MKAYITSVAARVIDKLDFSGLQTVAFVTTAADPYEHKDFVDLDRNALINKGLRITDIDLKAHDQESITKLLSTFDILFVCGGNTFYLLEKMRLCGLDKALPQLLDQGLVYIGSSAGSIVLSPAIDYIQTLDDPSKAQIDDYTGLHLIDFYVLPHYGREKYQSTIEQIMHTYKHLAIKTLRDDEAIIIAGNAVKNI